MQPSMVGHWNVALGTLLLGLSAEAAEPSAWVPERGAVSVGAGVERGGADTMVRVRVADGTTLGLTGGLVRGYDPNTTVFMSLSDVRRTERFAGVQLRQRLAQRGGAEWSLLAAGTGALTTATYIEPLGGSTDGPYQYESFNLSMGLGAELWLTERISVTVDTGLLSWGGWRSTYNSEQIDDSDGAQWIADIHAGAAVHYTFGGMQSVPEAPEKLGDAEIGLVAGLQLPNSSPAGGIRIRPTRGVTFDIGASAGASKSLLQQWPIFAPGHFGVVDLTVRLRGGQLDDVDIHVVLDVSAHRSTTNPTPDSTSRYPYAGAALGLGGEARLSRSFSLGADIMAPHFAAGRLNEDDETIRASQWGAVPSARLVAAVYMPSKANRSSE